MGADVAASPHCPFAGIFALRFGCLLREASKDDRSNRSSSLSLRSPFETRASFGVPASRRWCLCLAAPTFAPESFERRSGLNRSSNLISPGSSRSSRFGQFPRGLPAQGRNPGGSPLGRSGTCVPCSRSFRSRKPKPRFRPAAGSLAEASVPPDKPLDRDPLVCLFAAPGPKPGPARRSGQASSPVALR